jgi:hypothetical protein
MLVTGMEPADWFPWMACFCDIPCKQIKNSMEPVTMNFKNSFFILYGILRIIGKSQLIESALNFRATHEQAP